MILLLKPRQMIYSRCCGHHATHSGERTKHRQDAALPAESARAQQSLRGPAPLGYTGTEFFPSRLLSFMHLSFITKSPDQERGCAGRGTGQCRGYLVCAGATLERHLPHVLAVVLGNTARLDQGRHQVIFNGLELRGANIPLRKRKQNMVFRLITAHERGPGLLQAGAACLHPQHGHRSWGQGRPCSSPPSQGKEESHPRASTVSRSPHPGQPVEEPTAGVIISYTRSALKPAPPAAGHTCRRHPPQRDPLPHHCPSLRGTHPGHCQSGLGLAPLAFPKPSGSCTTWQD